MMMSERGRTQSNWMMHVNGIFQMINCPQMKEKDLTYKTINQVKLHVIKIFVI